MMSIDQRGSMENAIQSATSEEATYEKMLETLKEVDLFKIVEEQDDTDLKGEIACSANGCEIV